MDSSFLPKRGQGLFGARGHPPLMDKHISFPGQALGVAGRCEEPFAVLVFKRYHVTGFQSQLRAQARRKLNPPAIVDLCFQDSSPFIPTCP